MDGKSVELNEDTKVPLKIVASLAFVIVSLVAWGVRIESKLEAHDSRDLAQDQKILSVETRQEKYSDDVRAILTGLTEIRTELKYLKPKSARDN